MRFLLCLLLTLPLTLQAQDKGEQIIVQHLKAVKANQWNKVKNIQLKYRVQNKGRDFHQIVYYDKKLGVRTEYHLKNREGKEFKTFNLILPNGDGWQSAQADRTGGLVLMKMDSSAAQNQWNNLELISPFLNFKEQGRKFAYQGRELVKDVNYHKFILYYPNRRAEYIYINPENYLLSKRFLSSSQIEEFTNYSDFKLHEKLILLPETLETERGLFELEEIKINEDLSPTLFTKKSLKQ